MSGNPRASPGPHSSLEKWIRNVFPPVVHRFFFGQTEEFCLVRHFFHGLMGAVSATVLMLSFIPSLPLTFTQKMTSGSIVLGVCVVFGMLSSTFRCSLLLMLPTCLGSSGRSYLMVLILSVLYSGPVWNIQSNIQRAAESMSCNLDLQVNNSKLLWRDAIAPFQNITEELLRDEPKLKAETEKVNRNFHSLQAALASQYGYDFQSTDAGGSTQDKFFANTRMQCDRVVDDGVQRCTKWFEAKWSECMAKFPFPINEIFCVSMKSHFLCDIMRVMTPWCREQIPVEGNFGRLFDQLNVSMGQLSQEFKAKLVLTEEKEQPLLEGDLLDQKFLNAIKAPFSGIRERMETVMRVVEMMKNFTFIFILIRAVLYLRSYLNDLHFDNMYITSYFRHVDARRKLENKRCLLPLSKSEEKKFIHPCRLCVHRAEYKELLSGILHFLSLGVLAVMLLSLDSAVFHALDIISRHSFVQFNLTSRHLVDVRVNGDSMIAHLIRTTVSAFNSSSHVHIQTDNRHCVIPPASLSPGVYLTTVTCVLLMALLSILQVYTSRLRRVIASFFFPEREKKRVLFLYNLQIQTRVALQESGPSEVTGRTVCMGRRSRCCWNPLCCPAAMESSDEDLDHVQR
ncbi:E3 ubiquitin-protein ligase DCST1 isoform 3-T5 [Synchiropus picturatus]